MQWRVIALPMATVAASFLTAPSSARAGEVPLTGILPNVTSLEGATPWPRSHVKYQAFRQCLISTNKSVDCDPVQPWRFYELHSSAEVEDTYDMANRCIGLKGSRRRLIGPLQVIPAQLKVRCDPDPGEIAYSHLVVCHMPTTGARCAFSTVCFEGAGMSGRCVRNYAGVEIDVPATF